MESEVGRHVFPQILGAYRANSISGVETMLLLEVVADEGHLNLDVTERTRKVLPQITIFWWMGRGRGAIGLVPARREEVIAVGSLCFYLHGDTALPLCVTLLLRRKRRRVAVTETAHTSR